MRCTEVRHARVFEIEVKRPDSVIADVIPLNPTESPTWRGAPTAKLTGQSNATRLRITALIVTPKRNTNTPAGAEVHRRAQSKFARTAIIHYSGSRQTLKPITNTGMLSLRGAKNAPLKQALSLRLKTKDCAKNVLAKTSAAVVVA